MAKVNRLKKVNIYAKRSIRGTAYPPILGLHMGLMMSDKDIAKCLEGGADVYEVLSNGKTRKLLNNHPIEGTSAFKTPVKKVDKEPTMEELEELTKPDVIPPIDGKPKITNSSFDKESIKLSDGAINGNVGLESHFIEPDNAESSESAN